MNEQRMRPALYRSVMFWLGCFVLAFLVWAWVSSYKTGTSLYRVVIIEQMGAKPRAVYDEGVTVEGGSVRIYLARVSKPGPNVYVVREKAVFARSRAEAREKGAAFRWKSFHDAEVKLATVQRSYGEVPMWGVVALYLMVGGGVLVWRRRRWRSSNMEHRTPNIE